MLQAQGLRTRLEIRLNRIPVSLRRLKMGDLLLKYSEGASNIASHSSTSVMKESAPARALQPGHANARASPAPVSGIKRHR